MQLNRALVQPATETERAVLAGTLTLVGCASMIASAVLPWAEQAVFGISFTTLGMQDGAILLAVLAMTSAGVAVVVLLRRPVTVRVVIVVVVLAMAELGVAIWDATNIVRAIELVDSHQVLIGAIGTGAYGGVLGSLLTFAGGILAWTKRASSSGDGRPTY